MLVGGSAQQTVTDGLYVQGSGYTSDALLYSISNAPSKNSSDNHGRYKYAALFGRINYNWQNKYILNLSARRDGSSKFGPDSRYGNFASAGVAWIFSEEKWLRNNLSFISFGKLRASYGTTGSDGIDEYRYLSRWGSNGSFAYDGIPSLAPTIHANPNYRWQVNKKFEAAIDFGFLRDRIIFNIAYYQNRCGNQLIDFPVPNFTGFPTVTANSPALVQNSGVEITANAVLVASKKFRWDINFNTAFYRNKLVAYPNLELSPFASTYVVGQPLNIVRLLHYTGVDPQTGLYTFEDKNKDGKISIDYSGLTEDDRFVYNLVPKFIGGIGTNFSYQRLQVNLYFNIKKQIGVNAINRGDFPGRTLNQPVSILGKQWTKPGDIATLAKFTTQPFDDTYTNFKSFSDAGYTDASFIRLSNLAVSYSLQEKWIKKIGFSSCNVFFNTNNLFVITSYDGVDPETQNFGSLPPFKTLVWGLSFSF